jgi:ATP-dependent helicase/DNAse subunit B
MDRLIIQERIFDLPVVDSTKSNRLEAITPNIHAARALGVHPNSLQNLASEIIQNQALAIAKPVKSYQILKQAIKELLKPEDIEGYTRIMMPVVQNLLKNSKNLPNICDLSARSQKIIEVATLYLERLHQQKLVDPFELYWRALENIENRPAKARLIYGYFSASWDELTFIDAVCADGSRIYLSKDQEKTSFLEEKGWQIDFAKVTRKIQVGQYLAQRFLEENNKGLAPEFEIKAHEYKDQETEAREVLTQIKTLLSQGVLSDDIVIVSNDERAWGPLLLDVAWEFGIEVRLPYTISLTQTRLGAWIELLLEVIENELPYESTSRLLRHPLSPKLDSDILEQIRKKQPNNLSKWQDVLINTNLDIGNLQKTNELKKSEWLSYFRAIIDKFEIKRNSAQWAKEIVAFDFLNQEGLQEIFKSENLLLTWNQFRQELLTILKIVQTPAYPGREGVELHNFNSIVGANYKHVFIIDVAEGKIPKPITNNTLLDFFEQQQLNAKGFILPTAANLAKRQELNFYYLLSIATETITLSYSLIDRQGISYSTAQASSYFERLGLKLSEPSELAISSLEMARQLYLRQSETLEDPVLKSALVSYQIERKREGSNPPNEYDGEVGIPFDYSKHYFSVSQLSQLGQCPFKWFASKLLHLEKFDHLDLDLTPAQRGNLYHKVLELALSEWKLNPKIQLKDEKALEQWFIKAENELNFPTLPAWSSRRIEYIKKLKRAIENTEFLPADRQVLELEKYFNGQWEGLKFRGRIDRVDRNSHGIVLIDYKSGSKNYQLIKNSLGKAEIDLQLPIYRLAAAPNLYPKENVDRVIYYSISDAKELSPKESKENLNQAIVKLKQLMEQGSYRVDPDIKETACTFCDLDPVCRKGPRIKRKREIV